MSDEVIRVGIIGAGENTRLRHIPGLKAITGVEIVSVCNRTIESANRVALESGIAKTYANWRDLIADPGVNAIVIGTWPYMHCRATLTALAAEKHVLCEARMAMSAREAHAMCDAARAKPHLVAQIVPSPMTLRVDRTVKRLIAEGFVGEVLAIEVRAGGAFLDEQSPLHWRQNFDLSGFNTMSLGIWYEAIMRWVGHCARVSAMGKTFVTMRKDSAGVLRSVRVPEHLDVTADMECGAQAHFMISNVAGLAGPPEIFVFGSKGTLRYSEDRLYGGRRGDKALQEVTIPPDEQGRWRVEEEFVNAIRGKEIITHTTFEDGVKYMEFTEAAIRSMATGKAVSLPLTV